MTTQRRARNRGILEEELYQQVEKLARVFGWKIAHFRPAWTQKGWRTPVSGDGKGFPDCVLVRPPRTIFAELKREHEKPTPEQQMWLELLAACPGNEVYLWKPSGYEEIRRTLHPDSDIMKDILESEVA